MKAPSPYPRAVFYGILALLVLMLISVLWAIVEMIALHPGRPQTDYIDSLTVFYAAVAIPVVILFAWLAGKRAPSAQAIPVGLVVGLVPIVAELGTQLVATGTIASPVLLTGGVALSKLLSGLLGGWLASRTASPAADPEVQEDIAA